MLLGDPPFVNEQFLADTVSPGRLDALLADGWRHFGNQFFRYSYAFYEMDLRKVVPLRVRLENFTLSKSQRRTLKRNADLVTVVRPIEITAVGEELFHRHKRRFKIGVPESIYDFVSLKPSTEPCEAFEIAVYDDHRVVALSYFDIGASASSGIYAMFDPDLSQRRLGIFTLLKEIEFSMAAGKTFYYQGYAYEEESFYDYKKRIRGSEAFDWRGNWNSLNAS
jgi:arginyl-tRNA--protein-N-Asp/Glu arginylyltransferase